MLKKTSYHQDMLVKTDGSHEPSMRAFFQDISETKMNIMLNVVLLLNAFNHLTTGKLSKMRGVICSDPINLIWHMSKMQNNKKFNQNFWLNHFCVNLVAREAFEFTDAIIYLEEH